MANNKVALWTLECESADPEYLGKLDNGGATTLEALRNSLESNDVLEWAFEFWDVEDRRRVRKRLELLNGFGKDVHVIRVVEDDANGNKRRRLTTEPAIPLRVEVQLEERQFPDVEGEELVVPPAASSGVSVLGDSDEVVDNPLKSELLTAAVTDLYLERAKKLRVELKRAALEDHNWWVKTFDLNGSGVVKVWCDECKKDYGGNNKEHTKMQVNNLFNNFRRSHLVSVGHVRNFCKAKNINFEDHPQSTWSLHLHPKS